MTNQNINNLIQSIRKDFPILKTGVIYLDNAATSQRPKQVIDSLKYFMENENANINRSVYTLSEKAMLHFNESRKIIADFINAQENEIVFTKNATEAFNLLAYTLPQILEKGKNEIILSEMEHHSNLVPWQEIAKKYDLKLKFIKITKNYELDIEDYKSKLSDKTAIVSITHVSNVLGTINPVKEIVELAKKYNAITIIDASQSAPNLKIDVKNLNCDFLIFSNHKVLGPTGVGTLYGKYELLKKLPPFNFGGGMIKSVTFEKAEYLDPPEKFEAGTQNIGEVIASAEAIKYLNNLGMEKINKISEYLYDYAMEELNKIEGIEIYNPGQGKSVDIISFNLKGIHCHDVASILNEDKIAIR
ncbi:MAG: cysteine desulfurase, partial [Nanoarchaeota archaeon]